MIWMHIILSSCLILVFAYMFYQVHTRIDNLEMNITLITVHQVDGMKSSIKQLSDIQQILQIDLLKMQKEIDEMKEGWKIRVDSALKSLDDDVTLHIKSIIRESTVPGTEVMSRISTIVLDQEKMEENVANMKSNVHTLSSLFKRMETQIDELLDHPFRLKMMETNFHDLNTEVLKQGNDLTLLSYQMSEVNDRDERARTENENMKRSLLDLADRLKEEERSTSDWKDSVGGKMFNVIEKMWKMLAYTPERITRKRQN